MAAAPPAAAAAQDSLLCVFDLVFAYKDKPSAALKEEIAAIVTKELLVGVLEMCEAEYGWPHNAALYASLQKARADKAKILADAVLDAKEKHGQVEVLEAEIAVALHKARTHGRDSIGVLWSSADFKNVSTGKRIDLYLEGSRLGFAWGNFAQVRQGLDEVSKLLESGGDWDRRNRLKIYNGLRAMVARDFTKASSEFLSGLATFTSDELFSYERFCTYALLTSLVALDRVALKAKIIDSPEVVAVLDSAPAGSALMAAGKLLTALYECRYRDFMAELLVVNDVFLYDRYLSRHARWFLREMRVKAYAQFLTSYKSVKLAWMAHSFGVSVNFMDLELAQFIALNRFTAKIDKVAGVVETGSPDTSTAKFAQVIKHGDVLLNRVQKLARSVQV